MKRKILFTVNPISGTSNKTNISELIDKYIDKDKFEHEIRMSEYAGHASELASQAVREAVDIVVAVGGDGTVNEVARSLVKTNTALGIIPQGSGNGLARHLMIPLNVRKAIEIINDCQIEDLDYGLINNQPFFCTCGMGFDAFVSTKFAEAGKRGLITYLQKILEEWLKYEPETYVIKDEAGTERHKAFLVSCANASQYGNNAYIAPQASMSDGLLDLVIMEPFSLLEAPEMGLELINKTLDKNSKIKTFRASKLQIHRNKPGVIHIDGDPAMAGTDVEIELQPKGFKVVVNPRTSSEDRKPNALQSAAADFFNQLNTIRDHLNKQSRHVQAIGKVVQRKLNI